MTFESERASARADSFAQLAAAIDAAESVAWTRIGGPTAAELSAIKRLETALPPPTTRQDWQWLARRLARAVENGWIGDQCENLKRLAW